MSFSLATVIYGDETYQKNLEPCTKTSEISKLWRFRSSGKFPVARAYNRVIDNSDGCDYVVFAHPDVKFSEEFLGNVSSLFSSMPELGVIGTCGEDISGKTIRANKKETMRDLAFVDSCLFAVRKSEAIRFDSKRFPGFHMYAEDLCCEYRWSGKRVVCILDVGFKHFSTTFKKEGPCWGSYCSDREKMARKWKGKVNVVIS